VPEVAGGSKGARAPGRTPWGRIRFCAEILTKICLKMRIFWKKL